MNNEIKKAVNQACNQLIDLTLNDGLHESFQAKLSISPAMIYCSKFVDGQCLQPIETFCVPKNEGEIKGFLARVDLFTKETLRCFCK